MYQPEQPIFDTQPESTVTVSIGVEEVPKNWAQTLYFAFQITLVAFYLGRLFRGAGRPAGGGTAGYDRLLLLLYGYLYPAANYHR